MTIWLVGMMGAGKSAVGPRLAARLTLPFHDTDAEIAREADASVAELFARGGEAAERPLLHGLDAGSRRARLGEILARRERDYARAGLVVDVDDADGEAVVERVAARLAGPPGRRGEPPGSAQCRWSSATGGIPSP